MKLKLCACLVIGALVTVTQAVAAPIFTPFLSVDADAYRSSDQAQGPTQAGFQSWVLVEGLFQPWSSSTNAVGVTQVFPTSEGNITATVTGRTGGSRLARNRGATTPPNDALYQDFVFTSRVADGMGRHYIKLELAGLIPGQGYEITGFHRDTFNGFGGVDTAAAYQAWSDLAHLGADGPDAWLDTNVGVGATYQPAVGGVNNPIPTLARGPATGPAPGAGQDYLYSATFNSKADVTGKLTLYTWADPNGYGNATGGAQTATLLNGFQLGLVPEPTSMAMVIVGLVGMAGLRRRPC